MAPSDSALGYRPTALDAALASERTIAVVGPVAGLDEDKIHANLRLARDARPDARLALAPRVGEREWTFRSDVAGPAVVRRSDANTADLGALLTEIHGGAPDRGPLQVVVCGDYLVVDYSHGIGDGQLGLMLMAALSGDVDAERAGALAGGLPRNVTWTALRRHYLAHPSAVRDFLRLRRHNRQPEHEPTVGRREISAAALAKQSRTAYMAPACVAALRTWAGSHAPGASTAAVTMALWLAALRAAGVTVDDRVTMLVNCRRYLAPEDQGGHGNFAVALPVLMPSPPTPAAISEAMRGVIDSGWPIAILGMAQLKSATSRPGEHSTADPVIVPNRLRVAVSDLGRLGMFGHTTWAPGAPPQVAAYLEPDGPDAASLLVSELAGGRTFTASFCGAMVDPAVIGGALDRMCDDPVAILQTVRG